MWTPDAALKVWLYRRATDMRKSYDGLSALVKQQLHDDPLNGSLYVFRQLLLHCSTSRHPWRSCQSTSYADEVFVF